MKNVIKNVALKSVSLGNQYHHLHHRHQISRIFPGWMTRGGSRLSVMLLVVFVCFSVCVFSSFLDGTVGDFLGDEAGKLGADKGQNTCSKEGKRERGGGEKMLFRSLQTSMVSTARKIIS